MGGYKNEKSRPLRLMRLAYEVDPKWMAQFREYASQCRQEQPLPGVTALSALEQAQKAEVVKWLQLWIRQNQNMFTPWPMGGMFAAYQPRKPLVVFTSNAPGLIAAQETFVPRPATLIELPDTEYNAWMQQKPSDYLRSHQHFFYEFRPVYSQRFQEYRVEYEPKLDYWEQHSGTMYGRLQGSGEYILWQWDGKTASRASNPYLFWQS